MTHEKMLLFNFEYRIVGTEEWKRSNYPNQSHSSWAAMHAKTFLNDQAGKGITIEVREVIV